MSITERTAAQPVAAVAATRPDAPRDWYMDLLRVGSMFAVVFMHWISVVPRWQDGRITEQNVTALLPFLWPVSWIGDVMPVFFFVGGFANWGSWSRARAAGAHATDFVAHRYGRLLRPTFVFLALWMGLELVLRIGRFGGGGTLRLVSLGNTIPFGPMWFLAVYMGIVGLSPLTIAMHRRWGWRVVAGMLLGVALADACAFTLDRPEPLMLNVVLVWSIPHQLGYFYAEGRLQRLPRAALAAVTAGGLAGLAALTSLPGYPRSLVVPHFQIYGLDAPTMALVLSGLWMIGAALLLRGVLVRALQRERLRRLVSRCNEVAIAVYLWHMTAYLAAALLLGGTGMVFAEQPGTPWWLGRAPLLAVSGVVLALIVVAVRRVEGALHGPPLAQRFHRHAA